jgi:hypothetical protein
MKNTYVYPFPSLEVNVDDIGQFIKDLFIREFGQERLVDIDVDTYPNEYAFELIVTKYDDEVSEFISQLRELFVNKGLSVLILARAKENLKVKG